MCDLHDLHHYVAKASHILRKGAVVQQIAEAHSSTRIGGDSSSRETPSGTDEAVTNGRTLSELRCTSKRLGRSVFEDSPRRRCGQVRQALVPVVG
ncbi:hypothetical protein RB195_002243 [Necator americanus]|uniref:Uncharacterized protein n=1 Tax=Necator americanus TaxID=51031 RepID=A0ABR1DI41_NECAM